MQSVACTEHSAFLAQSPAFENAPLARHIILEQNSKPLSHSPIHAGRFRLGGEHILNSFCAGELAQEHGLRFVRKSQRLDFHRHDCRGYFDATWASETEGLLARQRMNQGGRIDMTGLRFGRLTVLEFEFVHEGTKLLTGIASGTAVLRRSFLGQR